MKPITLTLTILATFLVSATASAHVVEHYQQGLVSGLIHLLTEHALPIGAITVVAGSLLIQRMLRV
jgi:hypothetical protein